MSAIRREMRDVIGGGTVIAVGFAFFYRSFAYGVGTLSEMGAGFFPMVLSGVAIIIGLAILIDGLARKARKDPQHEGFALRPVLAVLGGIAAFALLLTPYGLGPAVAAAAAIAGLGDPENRWLNLAILAAFLAIVCWLIFSVGLKLPLPFFRGVF